MLERTDAMYLPSGDHLINPDWRKMSLKSILADELDERKLKAEPGGTLPMEERAFMKADLLKTQSAYEHVQLKLNLVQQSECEATNGPKDVWLPCCLFCGRDCSP